MSIFCFSVLPVYLCHYFSIWKVFLSFSFWVFSCDPFTLLPLFCLLLLLRLLLLLLLRSLFFCEKKLDQFVLIWNTLISFHSKGGGGRKQHHPKGGGAKQFHPKDGKKRQHHPKKEGKKQHHPKKEKANTTRQRTEEDASSTTRKDLPTTWRTADNSPKTESQKKNLPKTMRRGKVGFLLNDAIFLRGNDQCKLPCRDCWVSALFVCGKRLGCFCG